MFFLDSIKIILYICPTLKPIFLNIMKNLIKISTNKLPFLLMLVLVMNSFLFVSCDDDDDDMVAETLPEVEQEPVDPMPTFTVAGVAGTLDNLSTLYTAVGVAGLGDALSSAGPFTVFAPTNDAFARLDPTTLNNLIATPDLLAEVLQYHVVSGMVTSADLSNTSVPTLLGPTIDIDLTNGVMLNGNTNVINADVLATNGVVHLIDNVLIPEELDVETITQIAVGNPTFSTLVSILVKPEFADILAAASDASANLTVFAPTNDAFDALLAALGKSSIDEIPTTILREVVSYHILGSAITSDQLTDGAMAETLLPGESVTVDLSSGVMINNSNVIIPDVGAINGVIHAIDNVLLPSYVAQAVGTISEVVMFNADYSILFEALRTAELLETVSTAMDITVFAPNNDAFAAAGITSLDGLDAAALQPILLYHVLGAKVMADQLPADGMATTLSNDEKIYLGYLTNSVLINGLTTITDTDIEMSNGVIHTIDRTLVPPAGNIVDIAVAMADMGDNSEFTVLVSLLTMPEFADITQAVIDADNITLFAPTDAAFEAIADVIPTLTVDQIRSVLLYHAVGLRVFSTDLTEGQMVPTLNGEMLTVNLAGGPSLTDMSMGEDAAIIEVNVHGSNGVIHVIDKVLIPTL